MRILQRELLGSQGPAVDAIQKALITGNYEPFQERFRSWWDSTASTAETVQDENRILEETYYNRPMEQLLSEAPQPLRPLISGQVEAILLKHGDTNYGLRLIVYDWSKSPLVMGQPEALARAVEAQKTALHLLAAGANVPTACRTFAYQSGLCELYAESIGIPPGFDQPRSHQARRESSR